jgi:hypothetical protein
MEDLIEFIWDLWVLFMIGGAMILAASWMWEAVRDIFEGMR